MLATNTLKQHIRPLRDEFISLLEYSTSGQAMQKLLDDFEFNSVIDVGCGPGWHSRVLLENSKQVTAIDYNRHASLDLDDFAKNMNFIETDFMTFTIVEQFDCVWCAHVLEHQLNPHNFLLKIKDIVKEDGVIAITVPPLKHEVVGGHVTLWNAGTLIYNLVLAGMDCSQIAVLQYGYNISVIFKKKSIKLPDSLRFANGDLEKLAPFVPSFVKQGFDGNIYSHNWYGE
ncbi:bifunctional 2-polyprenyl-6-hydroxyphenol methylase/3-demethylubiquinol 3-O-methyltransferase UbiG [Paraglaciecola sp. L1A13]|uniref:class I SAM-dependent methyltransferase n=1 Tax=Paraglaciecola sp. L1A13 TaxID=2686359 RepID=UPI00131EA2A2|nr:class I SAM-dependent methyltransferase [Paraglaciecola sp. L1A13]